MATVGYPHISIGSDNVPVLTGTSIKVLEIALDHLAYGWGATEIQQQHPHFTLGQIHSALAYYYDHQVDMDAEILQRWHQADELRAVITARQGDSPLLRKLRAAGKLP
jgi:uncharacterized protein (DUF433 family)